MAQQRTIADGAANDTKGILVLKIGKCVTGPSRRLVADLDRMAYQYNRVVTAMYRAWQRWREDNPDWWPEPETDKKGEIIRDKDGCPKPKNLPLPLEMPMEFSDGATQYQILRKGVWITCVGGQPQEDGSLIYRLKKMKPRKPKWVAKVKEGETPKPPNPPQPTEGTVPASEWRERCSSTPETWLYHIGRKIAPDVNVAIISKAASAVMSGLKTKTPYNHTGKASYKWEAIVLNEEQVRAGLPGRREISFPVPCAQSAVCCQGVTSSKNASLSLAGLSTVLGTFPMFSPAAGRDHSSATFRIATRHLSLGQKIILQRIAAGEYKLCDSMVVKKEGKTKRKGRGVRRKAAKARRKGKPTRAGQKDIKGGWYWHLVYDKPGHDLRLDKERIAVLVPARLDEKGPFVMVIHPAPYEKEVLIGHKTVPSLIEVYKRKVSRREFMQRNYPYRGQGVRGHGWGNIQRALTPITQGAAGCMRSFYRLLMNDVINFCKHNNCGTIAYLEPGLQFRSNSWMASKDMAFTWDDFSSLLANKCKHFSIGLHIGVDAWKIVRPEKFKKAKKA